MKKVYILKIGGSVATQKSRNSLFVRRALLKEAARNIKKWKDANPSVKLILVHGAGGPGHYLARKYNLRDGVGGDKKKLKGAVLSRLANQKLDLEIFDIFVQEGLMVTPVHSGSVIIQKNKKISSINTQIIEHSLKNNCIPMLYGEMVFDEQLGMSVCSGDVSAAFLARKFEVEKVFFATDVDGVFDKDPHRNKDASLIKKISLKEINSGSGIVLEESHNQDVTGGLRGKIESFKDFFSVSTLKEIVIFNGKNGDNYKKVLDGELDACTQIVLK